MTLGKSKKRKKNTRMAGSSTNGGGARKKRKKSGHHGGGGMSGSGKRSGQKITLITKLYGGNYFGKQGITSKGTAKDKDKVVNLKDIETNLNKYGKEAGGSWTIGLSDHKILCGPKNYIVKNKMVITAREASTKAIEQVKKVGGEIVLPKKSKKPKK